MLCAETAGKIRRAHFPEGRSIKAVSRDLEVSHATVRKVLRSGAMEFAHEHRTTPPSTSSPRTHPKSSESCSGAAACARRHRRTPLSASPRSNSPASQGSKPPSGSRSRASSTSGPRGRSLPAHPHPSNNEGGRMGRESEMGN